jgi:hypothetical protein
MGYPRSRRRIAYRRHALPATRIVRSLYDPDAGLGAYVELALASLAAGVVAAGDGHDSPGQPAANEPVCVNVQPNRENADQFMIDR